MRPDGGKLWNPGREIWTLTSIHGKGKKLLYSVFTLRFLLLLLFLNYKILWQAEWSFSLSSKTDPQIYQYPAHILTLRDTTITSMKIMSLLTFVLVPHLKLPVRQLSFQVLQLSHIICPPYKHLLSVYPVTCSSEEFKDDSVHALKKLRVWGRQKPRK